MGRLSRRQGIGVIAITLLVVVLVGITTSRRAFSPRVTTEVLLRETGAPTAPVSALSQSDPREPLAASRAPSSPTPSHSAPTPPAEVVVHVAGAVKKPGVYHFPPGSRNDDAVKAAGGPTSKANLDAVNLAAHLEDATQLYIPTHQEQPIGGASGPLAQLTTPSATPHTSGTERPTHRSARKTSGKGGKAAKLSDPTTQGQININTATAEELQQVPGIGPTMAERILTYRQENHSFQSVEDLLQVSGIGNSKFAKMQPFLKVR